MSDDAGGRPTPPGTPPPERDHRPLRLPELDPLPWTGTAAPGNTGRPYGQAATLVAPPGTGWRPGAPAAVDAATVREPGPARGAAVPAGGSSGLTGSDPASPHPDRMAVVSADRAGRRALRTALTGLVLFLLAFAFQAGAPGLASIAALIAFVAGVAAFVRGIGAVRQARRARVSGARGGLAIAIGAMALCLVLVVLAVFVAHRSDFSRYVTCTQEAAGSAAAIQQCSRDLSNVLEQSMGG